jgi:hypothetical protein
MITTVPGCVRSAYGPGADTLDLGKSLDSGIGWVKDGVAFGAMRNVEAGAMIFLSSGLRCSDVRGMGATRSITLAIGTSLHGGGHTDVW